MYNDVNTYVDFLIDHGLTQNQFLALYLIYTKRKDIIKKYKAAKGELLTQEEKDDLFERKYLTRKIIKGKSRIRLGDTFENSFLDKERAGEEIWEIYPAFSSSNGINYPLKSMDFYTFCDEYYKVYKGVLNEHKKILDDLKYAVRIGLIKVKIKNWIASRMYLDIRKMREEDGDIDDGGGSYQSDAHDF